MTRQTKRLVDRDRVDGDTSTWWQADAAFKRSALAADDDDMDTNVVVAGRQLPPPLANPAESTGDIPSETPKRKGLSTTARVLILVCGSATVLGYGLTSLEANRQRSEPPVADFPVRNAGELSSVAVGQPNELGLEPSGALVARVGQDAVVYTDAQGSTWEAIIDASSGDPVATLRSPGAGQPPVRFDVPLAMADVVPMSIDTYVLSTSSPSGDGGEIISSTIDVARLRADNPALLTSWARSVGLAPDDLGLGAADTAVLELLVDPAGTIRSFVFRVDAAGQQVTYVRTPAQR